MSLAEWDDPMKTLLFNRPHKPLGIGIEIRTLRRQPDRASLQDFAKDPSVERISIVNQLAHGPQQAVDRVGQVAGYLLHPRAAGLRVDPCGVLHRACQGPGRRTGAPAAPTRWGLLT